MREVLHATRVLPSAAHSGTVSPIDFTTERSFAREPPTVVLVGPPKPYGPKDGPNAAQTLQ